MLAVIRALWLTENAASGLESIIHARLAFARLNSVNFASFDINIRRRIFRPRLFSFMPVYGVNCEPDVSQDIFLFYPYIESFFCHLHEAISLILLSSK